MNAHSRWLVDYSDTFVFMNHVERNVFSKSLEQRQLNRTRNDDLFSSAQLHGRLGDFSIDQDLFLLDELLHAHAADLGQLGDEPLIQARAGGIDRDRESLR